MHAPRWTIAALFWTMALPAAAEPRAVIELFTSQGCSSCPPADAALRRFAGDDDYVALAYHVDYWNYLGWADTLSIPEAAERQRAYAAGREETAVFTPQVVVNGRVGILGHDEGAIREAAADLAADGRGLPVPVSVTRDGDRLLVAVGAAPGSRAATVWLATFSGAVPVNIEAGENAGRTIDYANVVRTLRPIGVYEGVELVLELPADGVLDAAADGCAILVQANEDGRPGAMLGAALLDSDP